MEILELIKEDVLEAFSTGRTGVPAAAEEFGITRTAVYLWPNGKQIPAERRLHLLINRPDIIEKIKSIRISRKNASLPAEQPSTEGAAA